MSLAQEMLIDILMSKRADAIERAKIFSDICGDRKDSTLTCILAGLYFVAGSELASLPIGPLSDRRHALHTLLDMVFTEVAAAKAEQNAP